MTHDPQDPDPIILFVHLFPSKGEETGRPSFSQPGLDPFVVGL